jgi:lipopolysaccharide export system permease protein
VSRIDWLILRRVMARIALTLVIFFALLALVESLNTTKLRVLNSLGGPPLAAAGIVLSALRNSLGALPVTVLIGTIAGVLDLQARREFMIVQALGISIWRVVRAPLILVLLLTAFASMGGETLLILGNRAMPGEPINNQAGSTWLEQHGKSGIYLLHAERLTADPPAIYGVTLFMTRSAERERIESDRGDLVDGKWVFGTAVRYRLDSGSEELSNFSIATQTTRADLYLQATGARDLTLPELLESVASSLSEAEYRFVTETSLYRTLMLPLMVAGSVLIGFATASGYRRKVNYGNVVLFGIVAGFVIFTINEMAIRAGNSGVLPPMAATAGPALVSVLVGITALLYSQDGTLRR